MASKRVEASARHGAFAGNVASFGAQRTSMAAMRTASRRTAVMTQAKVTMRPIHLLLPPSEVVCITYPPH